MKKLVLLRRKLSLAMSALERIAKKDPENSIAKECLQEIENIEEKEGMFKERFEGDPYMDWINSHREILEKHPDTFMLLSPEKGIVITAKNQDEYIKKYRSLPEEDKDGLMFHTSMFGYCKENQNASL